jgi:hypothetical protein
MWKVFTLPTSASDLSTTNQVWNTLFLSKIFRSSSKKDPKPPSSPMDPNMEDFFLQKGHVTRMWISKNAHLRSHSNFAQFNFSVEGVEAIVISLEPNGFQKSMLADPSQNGRQIEMRYTFCSSEYFSFFLLHLVPVSDTLKKPCRGFYVSQNILYTSFEIDRIQNIIHIGNCLFNF